MFFTLEQIRCLQAIKREGSLTRAAESVYKAKSALVYSIGTLTEQLGFELLDKSSYRTQLTPKGEEFLLKSIPLLNEYQTLIENAEKIRSGVEMRLTISGSGVCSLDKLYGVIKKAMKTYPCTEIILHREILSGEKMLEDDIVDLALLEELNNKEDFEYKRLELFKLPLVISAKHEFLKLKKKDQSLKNLKKFPQIIQSSTIQSDYGSRSVHKDSIKWKVTDTLSKSELIENGLGWGRLPDHLIQKKIKAKQLHHLKHLDDEPKLYAYLCRKKTKQHGEVCDFIWNSF